MPSQAQLEALAKGRAKLAKQRAGGELKRTKPLSKKSVLHRRSTTTKVAKNKDKQIKVQVQRLPGLPGHLGNSPPQNGLPGTYLNKLPRAPLDIKKTLSYFRSKFPEAL